MNLIISGDNPQSLAKVEALARELGLEVSHELSREPAHQPSHFHPASRRKTVVRPEETEHHHQDQSPLYGIE